MVETLIYNTLQGCEVLQRELAVYEGKPAIFYQQLPHDMEQWQGDSSFPRVIYNIEWRYHPERKADGSMTIDIFCTNTTKIAPEDLAREIATVFEGLFLTEKEESYGVAWDRTDSFAMEGSEPMVSGVTMTFDVFRFVKQEGISPCPVWGMHTFLKEYQPNCILLGRDTLPEKLYATAKYPIVFVKKESSKTIKTSYAMAWLESTLSISVLSSNEEKTRKWVTALYRDIALERETVMENGSPFLVMDVQEMAGKLPLSMGQITVTGQYGILRQEPEGIKLNHGIFTGRRE